MHGTAKARNEHDETQLSHGLGVYFFCPPLIGFGIQGSSAAWDIEPSEPPKERVVATARALGSSPLVEPLLKPYKVGEGWFLYGFELPPKIVPSARPKVNCVSVEVVAPDAHMSPPADPNDSVDMSECVGVC